MIGFGKAMPLAREGDGAEPGVSGETGGFGSVLADSQNQLSALIHTIMQQIHTQHEAELQAVRCMEHKPAEEDDPPKRNHSLAARRSRVSEAFPPSATKASCSQEPSQLAVTLLNDGRTAKSKPTACHPEWVQLDVLSLDDDQPAWYDLDCLDKRPRHSGQPAPVTLAKIWRRGSSEQMVCKHSSKRRGDMDVFSVSCYRGRTKRESKTLSWQHYALVEPSSLWNVVWRVVGILLLIFDVVTIPMTVFDIQDTSFMRGMMFVTIFFWTVDMLLLFFRGYINEEGHLEIRRCKIVMKYLKTYFLQDLALLVIEWVNFFHTMLKEGEDGAGNRSASVMRALRFMRLLKVTKATRLMEALAGLVLTISSVPKMLFTGFFVLHFSACIWHAISGEPGELLISYTTAFRWALFGWAFDEPTSLWEGIYSIWVSLLSLAMLEILTAGIVTDMTLKRDKFKTQRDQDSRLRLFLSSHNISWGLRSRVWTFLRKVEQEDTYISKNSVEMLRVLPAILSLQLKVELYIPVLTVHPFFSNYAVSVADSQPMRLLVESQVISEKALVVEHELFTYDGPAEYMYFLVHGRLYYRGVDRSRPSGWESARASIDLRFESPVDYQIAQSLTLANMVKHFFQPKTIGRQSAMSLSSELLPGDGSNVVTVQPGDWLCEAALWLQWRHVGIAAAKTESECLALEAQGFQRIMHRELPEAQRYAKLFYLYARDHQRGLSDFFQDVKALQEIAREVFEPPLFFLVERCKPQVDGGHNEWQPTDRRQWRILWSSAWKEGHAFNTSALVSTLTLDMKNDIVLMYQTLFAQNLPNAMKVTLKPEESLQHDQRVLFFKRLLLSLAVCRLRLSMEDNGQAVMSWPYPLAAALCHGGRILVHIKDVSWKSFLNLLLFGEEDAWRWDDGHIPAPFYKRHAASHGMQLDPKTSTWHETKLNKLASFNGNNLGMDLPLGGLGNTVPTSSSLHGQCYIGPSGVPLKKAWMSQGTMEYVKDVQHGHLYLRFDESAGHGTCDSVVLSLDDGHVDLDETLLKWSNSLECWLPVDAYNTSWNEVPPVRTSAELDLLLGGSCGEGSAEQLHRLWVIRKELSIEHNNDWRLRCRGLLVELSIIRSDGAAERVLVQTGATARLEEADRPNKDITSMAWHIDKVCLPTCVCDQQEVWKTTISRYLQNVLGLSDAAVRRLLGACQDGEKPYVFRSGPVTTICHRHASACPSDMETIYDVLHLTVRLQPELHHLVEPILAERLVTKEHTGICGFGTCSLPNAEGTIVREWQWLSMKSTQVQALQLSCPKGGHQLTLKACSGSSALLLGIECSAPLKKDFFGQTHGADAASKSLSAFGKRKWRDYRHCGQQVPADLGGLHMHVNEATLQQLRQVFQLLPLTKPSDGYSRGRHLKSELEIFQKLLQSSDAQIGSILEEHVLLSRSGFLL